MAKKDERHCIKNQGCESKDSEAACRQDVRDRGIESTKAESPKGQSAKTLDGRRGCRGVYPFSISQSASRRASWNISISTRCWWPWRCRPRRPMPASTRATRNLFPIADTPQKMIALGED